MISTFATDGGGLRPIGDVPTGGQTPRHFAVVNNELYVGNQDTDTVRSYRIDPSTGAVTVTGTQLRVRNPAVLLLRRE